MHTANFKNIVGEYKNLVYSQAFYSTGNRHDASDITQEVLIRLWKNMDIIRPQTVKSWLLTVTRNCCIDMTRKKREQYFTDFFSEDEDISGNQIPDNRNNNPEQCLDQHERRQRVISAITGLPEKIRTALILRYIHDESYEIIAETLGVPVNSVKVYLHRGRKMLAPKLNTKIKV